MTPDCEVQVEDHQSDLPLFITPIAPLVCSVMQGEQERADQVTIYFVSSSQSAAMHDAHFGDPSPTDCMSFPMDGPKEPRRMLGEVVVCPKVAIEYARQTGGDPYQEVALYVVHGVLHLLGYRDSTSQEIEQMRQAERRYHREMVVCARGLKEK